MKTGETVYIQLLPEDPLVDKSFAYQNLGGAFPTYPKERYKTVLAVGLFLLCGFINGAVTALITDLVPRQPLPDFIFQYVPEQRWAWPVADWIACTIGFLTITFSVLHEHRWIVVRRIFFIIAQLYVLRSICMGVTWVAIPGEFHSMRCVELTDPKQYWNVAGKRILKFMLTLGVLPIETGGRLLCGDLIFSGHSLVMVLSWITVCTYLPSKKCRPVKFMWGLGSIVGMALIIFCRMHYTVDVVLAVIITSLYYSIFHFIISTPNDDQWMNRLKYVFWLLPLTRYFEVNVPCYPVPRKLEWPFSKPSLLRKFVKQLNDY